MRIVIACILVVTFVFSVNAALAMGDAGKTRSAGQGDQMPEPSPMHPLDEVEGTGTSDRLSAQGTVGYDANTGMMNVVPSDSVGNLED